MHRWKVEVEENTKLTFWRKKDIRSSDKFALDELIAVFLAARIGSKENLASEDLGYILCVFYRRESLFEMLVYQLALCYWLFGQADAKLKQMF